VTDRLTEIERALIGQYHYVIRSLSGLAVFFALFGRYTDHLIGHMMGVFAQDENANLWLVPHVLRVVIRAGRGLSPQDQEDTNCPLGWPTRCIHL
jgi:hypothetical protein